MQLIHDSKFSHWIKTGGRYLKVYIQMTFFFELDIYSLLGEKLTNVHFIIIDFDYTFSMNFKPALNPRREVIGFASNDVSYYKTERAGIRIILDKKARIKDVLNFLLFRTSVALYNLNSTLTLREKETLLLLTDGRSIKDIAKENTVYSFR